MRSVRLGLVELWRVLRMRKIRAALCVVALVPLLYGGLYLWAFWDPYSRLDKLPVAVVNLDQPVTANGQSISAGTELLAQLSKSDSFDWQVMSAEKAKQGLDDHSYQSSLTIPANFSAALASASGDTPVKAELLVQDEGTNILTSQITNRVLAEVRTAASEKASATYLDNIYVSFSQIHDGLQTAADSAGQLATGIASAQTGAVTLQRGLTSADSAAAQLGAGMSKLSSGTDALKQGSDAVASGASTLASKLSGAASGAESLAAGATSATNGATQLAAGLAKLDSSGAILGSSATTVAAGAGQVSTGAANLAAGGQQAAAGGAQLASGAENLASLLAALANAHPELSSDPTFVQAQATGAQVAGGAQELATALSSEAKGAQQLATGAQTLQTGAEALSKGVSTYVTGVSAAATAATQLSSGLTAVKTVSQSLASGLSTAQAGATALAQGSAKLASGTGTLETGIGTAGTGVQELSTGLGTLAKGSSSLATGIAQGADGAKQLASGLTDSAGEIPNDAATERQTRTEVMSSPISLSESTTHLIPNYGTGFSPYFIPLALWVGALMTFFLVRALGSRALSSTASNVTVAFSGYWPAAVVTTVQAVIMMLVLQFALGLHLASVPLFYVFGIFVALIFTAIMLFLNACMGTAGKFVAIVLLMLQLTSAAGTFAYELLPRFFQVINPFLPMTYVVSGLRDVITLGNNGSLAWDAGALLIFGVLAIAATIVTVWRKRVWTMDRLKPAVSI